MRIAFFLAAALVAPGLADSTADRAAAHRQMQGVWSFDGTCSSGYGMGLRADGSAWHDEGGSGMWTLRSPTQLVLIIAVSEMGSDEPPSGPAGLLEYTVSNFDAAAGTMTLTERDGTIIHALRCPP
jgi:hypothetical protein